MILIIDRLVQKRYQRNGRHNQVCFRKGRQMLEKK